jgi:hypothetical protein
MALEADFDRAAPSLSGSLSRDGAHPWISDLTPFQHDTLLEHTLLVRDTEVILGLPAHRNPKL